MPLQNSGEKIKVCLVAGKSVSRLQTTTTGSTGDGARDTKFSTENNENPQFASGVERERETDLECKP